MFASDIHGDAECAKKLFEAYDREGAKKLILLGDLLYHGPRNDLPSGYAPKKTIALLNERAGELMCVKGNCEADVDSMVLTFPIEAEYALLSLEGRTCYIAHGHRIGENNTASLLSGDILITGHTHVYKVKELDSGVLYINPGSVSLPKEGKEKTYMTYENGVFEIKALTDGKTLLSADIRR